MTIGESTFKSVIKRLGNASDNTRRETITKGTTRRDNTLPYNGNTLPTAATEELSERSERASVSPPPRPPTAAASPTTARSAVLGSPRPASPTGRAPNPAASRAYLQVGEVLSPRARVSFSLSLRLRASYKRVSWNFRRGQLESQFHRLRLCYSCAIELTSPRDDTRYALDDWLSNNPSRVDNLARRKIYRLTWHTLARTEDGFLKQVRYYEIL